MPSVGDRAKGKVVKSRVFVMSSLFSFASSAINRPSNWANAAGQGWGEVERAELGLRVEVGGECQGGLEEEWGAEEKAGREVENRMFRKPWCGLYFPRLSQLNLPVPFLFFHPSWTMQGGLETDEETEHRDLLTLVTK